MSKVTTADCVAFIVANTLPKSYVADWKRTRKAKQGDDIVRTFLNKNTGAELNIIEKPDGKLVGAVKAQPTGQPVQSPKKGKPKAYFVILRYDPEMAVNNITLCVCDVGHWHSQYCHSDFTPKGTFEELKRLGIPGAELQEGVVEFYQNPDPATLKAKLASSSFFEFNEDFEKFMQKYDSEESSVIPWNSICSATPVSATAQEEPVSERDFIAFLHMNSSSDWKQVSSVKTGSDTIHTFVSPTGKGMAMMIEVSENKVREYVKACKEAEKNPAPAYVAPYQPTNKDWAAIKANPITVDLHRAVFPKETDPEYQGEYASDFQSRDGEWTGRIVFDKAYIEDDEVSFYCGPEEKGGSLEDTLDGGTGEKLNTLFADMNPDIGAAENFHTIPIIDGVSGKEIWKVIEERLARSGAVWMDENEDDDEEDDDEEEDD